MDRKFIIGAKMEIQDQIKEAINQNLPTAVAIELKKFIAEAENLKEKLSAKKEQCESLRSELKISNDLVEKIRKREECIEAREAKVADRESIVGDHEVKLQFAQKDVNCGNEKVELLRDMMTIIFRNTETRSQICKNKTHVVPYNANGYGPDTVISNDTKTETKEIV